MPKIQVEPEARHASVEEVLSFLKASSCRLVYRRLKTAKLTDWKERREVRRAGSTIYLVEYRADDRKRVLHQVRDVKAFAPLFSPDGTRVAFSNTFYESDIFVMPLDTCEPVRVAFGAHPHWWIDPSRGASYIVYRTENGVYTGFPPGKTLRQRLGPDNKPVGDPEVICPYGFGGGISRNGRHLATGYTHLIVADLETGEYFQPLGDRQLPDGENQVCDVSIAPDDSPRVMQLRLTLSGEGRHDFFGIVSFDGSWYLKIDKPKGTEEWQTPEWSTHPNFATASGTNPDQTYDLYIIRLSDLAILRLTWEGGYGHAHLWVGPQA